MIILKIFLYFISLLVPGYLTLWCIKTRRPLANLLNLALGYGLGSFFVTLLYFTAVFWMHMAASLSLWWLVCLIISLLSGFFIFFRHGIQATETKNIKEIKTTKRQKIIILIIIAFVVVNSVSLISSTLVRPVATFDSLSMWSGKAKTLYFNNKLDFNPDSQYFLGGGGHNNYPWQIPLMQLGLSLNFGGYNDLYTNFIFLAFFIALLILVHSFLFRITNFYKATILTFFLFSLPLVFYHGFNSYADLALSFYITGSLIYLFKWLEFKNRADYYLSISFFAAAFFVKDAALLYLPAFFAIFFYQILKKEIKKYECFRYFISSFCLLLPWIFFKFMWNLSYSNSGSGLNMIFPVKLILSFLGSLFVSYSWNIWIFIAILVFIIKFKKIINDKLAFSAWIFVGISIISLILAFSFAAVSQYAYDQTALSRTMMPLIISSFLAVGFSLKENKI
ncbi:MAG: hypothetical protein WCN88_00440 [Candidatus Falkowbacteria bacterium]